MAVGQELGILGAGEDVGILVSCECQRELTLASNGENNWHSQESQLILQNWATCPNRPNQASAMPKPGSCEPARRSCRVCFAGEPSLPRWPLHPSCWSPSRQPSRTSSQCSRQSQAGQAVRAEPAKRPGRPASWAGPAAPAAQPHLWPWACRAAARSMGLIFLQRAGHKKTNPKDQPQGAATQKIN